MTRTIIGRLILGTLQQRLRKRYSAGAKPKASLRPWLEVLEDRRTPSTFTVNGTGDTGAGSGLNGDLRYCITQANSNGGTNAIQFDPTVFGTPHTITLKSLLPAITDNNLTVTGPGTSLVTISGNKLYQVFNVTAANASLSGLTIANGSASSGAGIKFGGLGTLTISNTVIANNSASSAGGGLFSNTTGTMALTNSVISGNFAKQGSGGICNAGNGTVIVTNCTLSGNSTSGGSFNGNNSVGGAIRNFGTLIVTNSTLSGNFAYNMGGAIMDQGTATLTDCTLSGNSVSTASTGGRGGAISSLTATLTNCTLSGNSAKIGGGLNTGTGPATLNNTLIAGNTASNSGPDVNGTVNSSSGFNLIGNGANMTGITNGINGNQIGTSQSPINPLLAALGNYGGPTQTMALLPGSPALDAGSNALDGGATTDQRGDPRIVNGTVDIGAFESQGFTVTVSGGDNQSTVVNTAFTFPLAVTVSSSAGEPVAGGVVTFTPPSSGASATLSATTVTLNSSGQASVTATANNAAGSYMVSVSAGGANAQADFNCTNVAALSSPPPGQAPRMNRQQPSDHPLGADALSATHGSTPAVAPMHSWSTQAGVADAINALFLSRGRDGQNKDGIDALFAAF